MKSMRTLMFAGLAAAGLALAGCGSDGGPSQAELDAANDRAAEQAQMVANLQAEINALRADLGLGEDDDLSGSIDELNEEIAALKKQIQDAADAVADAAKKARLAEMAATAAKLYAGIAAQNDTSGADQRSADYSGTNDANITVNYGATPTTQQLTQDKKAMVADNHGWEGKKYMASGAGVDGTYEAVVYSNVGEPMEGAKFSTTPDNDAGLTAPTDDSGQYGISTTGAEAQARVASPSFDQSAGTKMFELPDNTLRVMIPGSYHGVSGTYSCTPADANTDCSATVASRGFTLGGGTWTFKPGNPEARVMSTPDAHYASYGWWIHKSADGKTFTASAFVDDKDDGTEANVPAATGITALQGTATYMGGAAGKYALSSSTGGTNDAGHFTARATLEADFGDDMITGTIDDFIGADGMSRDWSVELMEQTITDTGLINGTDGAGAGGASMTKWTIDGMAGDADGQWRGSLQDNGDDGVPKVGTGTFHSTYGQGNSMVGAFGATKE